MFYFFRSHFVFHWGCIQAMEWSEAISHLGRCLSFSSIRNNRSLWDCNQCEQPFKLLRCKWAGLASLHTRQALAGGSQSDSSWKHANRTPGLSSPLRVTGTTFNLRKTSITLSAPVSRLAASATTSHGPRWPTLRRWYTTAWNSWSAKRWINHAKFISQQFYVLQLKRMSIWWN